MMNRIFLRFPDESVKFVSGFRWKICPDTSIKLVFREADCILPESSLRAKDPIGRWLEAGNKKSR